MADLFYSYDRNVEYLKCESKADAICDFFESLHAERLRDAYEGDALDQQILKLITENTPVCIFEWQRATMDLTRWADDMVETMVDRISEEGELSGPEGEHDPLKDVDLEALKDAVKKAIDPFSAYAKPWHCEATGFSYEFTAAEVFSILFEHREWWFKARKKEDGNPND